jgi:hypothetical protein
MKILAVCFSMLFAFFGYAQQNTKQTQYINAIVGFYNLENLYDTIDDPRIDDEEFLPKSGKKYNTFAYNRKLQNMANVIKGIGTDQNPEGAALLGVVEIENKGVLQDLVNNDSLKSRNYQIVHFDSPDARGIDVGLLYNPKYFTLKTASKHTVTLADKHPTRDVLLAQGDFVGENIYVMVNHWPSRRGSSNSYDLSQKERAYNRNNRTFVDRNTSQVTRQERTDLSENEGLQAQGGETSNGSREAAAKVCKKLTDSIYAVNPKAKIIIMGDLNDDPINTSLTKVLQTVDDAANVPEKGLFNIFGNTYKKGYGSLAYNGKWNLFDQIIVSQSFINQEQLNGWFFYSAHIYARDFLINQKGDYKGYPKRSWVGNNWNEGYSDHFPTYTVLAMGFTEE